MGEHTKGRQLYIQKLADDLEGLPDFDDHDIKPWFEAGIIFESWARGWYQFERGVDVGETGFVVHDDHPRLGCSPDGLVGEDGLLEIKYRHNLRTFDQAVEKGPTREMAQVQCQLYVTGRKWCDYVNYWRGESEGEERGHILRVYPDKGYIEETLLPGVLGFWGDVQAELRARKQQRRVS